MKAFSVCNSTVLVLYAALMSRHYVRSCSSITFAQKNFAATTGDTASRPYLAITTIDAVFFNRDPCKTFLPFVICKLAPTVQFPSPVITRVRRMRGIIRSWRSWSSNLSSEAPLSRQKSSSLRWHDLRIPVYFRALPPTHNDHAHKASPTPLGFKFLARTLLHTTIIHLNANNHC